MEQRFANRICLMFGCHISHRTNNKASLQTVANKQLYLKMRFYFKIYCLTCPCQANNTTPNQLN